LRKGVGFSRRPVRRPGRFETDFSTPFSFRGFQMFAYLLMLVGMAVGMAGAVIVGGGLV
jgi:hypothetical protein